MISNDYIFELELLLNTANAEIERLKAENFALAANQCHHPSSNETGDHGCEYADKFNCLQSENAKLLAEIARLNRIIEDIG